MANTEKGKEEIRFKFCVGELVHHKKYDYHGVVVGADPVFKNSADWYEMMTQKYPPQDKPPRDKPWYHVQIHNRNGLRYVCERNLEKDPATFN